MNNASILNIHLEGSFSREEMLRSPLLEGRDPAVKIAVDQIRRYEGSLCFRVLLTYGLPNDYLTSFGNIGAAHVLVVRDTHGRGGVTNLVDPSMNPVDEPNFGFVDRRFPEPSIIFATGRMNVQVEVDSVDAVFVHAALHGIVSNVVRVSEESS